MKMTSQSVHKWLWIVAVQFASIVSGQTKDFTIDLKMPGVTPTFKDQYFCTFKRVSVDESFIVKFEPHANAFQAHHMILFGSKLEDDSMQEYPNFWDCGHGGLPSGISIMFAWAKNAPPVTLPKDVGFKIGAKTDIKYLILQVHYAKPLATGETDQTGLTLQLTYQTQKYQAGIYLLADSHSTIPPYKPKFHVDINCRFSWTEPIYLFAYRVHAHQLGVVITGYKFNTRNESLTLLAKGNPQWPQAFYPMNSVQTVTKEDILASRCTFNSMSRKISTSMGFNSEDEMCNLYLMYYVNSENILSPESASCDSNSFPHMSDKLPLDSDTPLPSNPQLEEIAAGQQVEPIQVAKKSERIELERNNFDDNYKYTEVPNWPNPELKFGQLSAVTIDNNGNIVVFHRGNHVWNGFTFDIYEQYSKVDEGPITEHTVVTLDHQTGQVLHQWGNNLFYMPHGLTIDTKGNFWLTDVAMHQIFKFPNGSDKAELTIGERFKPGNDQIHFCKPTSVAVSLNEDIYVADGYCNSRIVKFSSKGKYISQFGESNILRINPPPINTFEIPHKIILAEDESLICVADRENGRIQCFTTEDGKFSFQIARDEFHHRLFSISATRAKGGLIYAVCGPGLTPQDSHPVEAFVFNLTSKTLLNIVTPKQGTFSQPHDIAITPNSRDLYIVEIGPNNVWKFVQANSKSAKKELNSLPPVSHVSPSVSIKKIGTSSAVAEASSFATSMIIMALLGIPILLLVLITVVVRLKKRGKFVHCSLPQVKGWLSGYRTPRNSQEKFNIGSLLNPHKGFDRVALDESDIEVDEKSDSDIEEFNAVVTRKA